MRCHKVVLFLLMNIFSNLVDVNVHQVKALMQKKSLRARTQEASRAEAQPSCLDERVITSGLSYVWKVLCESVHEKMIMINTIGARQHHNTFVRVIQGLPP